MKLTGASADILRQLAETPFLGRGEISPMTGWSNSEAYRAADRLEDLGLVGAVPHATELLSRTERYYMTAAGVEELARLAGKPVEAILRGYPVSAQWQNLLMERLDAFAAIYRVAVLIADYYPPTRMRWYRADALDASITLGDGRTIGIIRQGQMSDRSSFAKRLGRLRDGPMPGGIIVLTQDEIRRRHTRRMLFTERVPTFVGVESDAVFAGPDDRIWQMPSGNAKVDIDAALRQASTLGSLPVEPHLMKVDTPTDLNNDVPLDNVHPRHLPAALYPADKRALNLIGDWPGINYPTLRRLMEISPSRLSQIMGRLRTTGLIQHLSLDGRRVALSDLGLGLLARRDRASVGTARQRWSVMPVDPALPLDWENVSGRRVRQLLRNSEHTDAVHRFLADTVERARGDGWENIQLDPPHRASRYFRHNGSVRAINPDAFVMMKRGREVKAFFLEWERRAVRPSTMRERLAPYLRYYSTDRPRDDHGFTPEVLIVVEDEVTAANFRKVAREEMAGARVTIPIDIDCSEDVISHSREGRTPVN